MSKLEQAIQLATKLHKGQVDKAGKSYIEHLLRVMNAVEGETAKTIAVLHDTLEDTNITFAELESLFGTVVASAIRTLSRRGSEDYFDFINRVKEDSIAVKVKIADLEDNMDLSRLKEASKSDLERNTRYQKALRILKKNL